MKNLSRYILVSVTIISLSIILPWMYWLTFEKPIPKPFVMYSCVDDSFMISGTDENGVYRRMNDKGDEFTREEFEQKLPLLNFRQLMISKTLPDTIKGVEMDPHLVNGARSTFKFKPRYMKSPKPGLYPMIESESGRASLSMPEDYFRINSRFEFIIADGNKIDEQKTELFTKAVKEHGFEFPAKMIEGLPTTRKSCDEGYFVVDAVDQVFHVKMIKGQPYVKQVVVPKGLSFKYIACVDFKNKSYYCYLIGSDNKIFIITQDDYDLVRLPVDGFNPDNQELMIYGDLFNYNVVTLAEDFMKVTVLDDNMNKVDEYLKTWTKRSLTPEGKSFSYLFPAEINQTDKYNSYINFYFHPTKGFNWIILHIILLLTQFFIVFKRKANPKNHIVDFGIVLVTGLFGFLAVNIFPNKFFD